MKQILTIIIGFLILVSCTPNESKFKSTVPPLEERIVQSDKPRLAGDQPLEINLDVPFFSQAPDADWGMPWQEACEEAAVLLAYYYATDQSPTKEEFKADIQKLVDWQIENYGDYEHTDIEQTAEMLRENFLSQSLITEGEQALVRLQDINLNIIKNPSIEELKQELSQGHPIIAPFAGRQLGNPFYSAEGPYYHMMVIRGYDEKHFITNDVGTKRGENFIYPYETIMSAMHEWHDTDINLGEAKVIVLY